MNDFIKKAQNLGKVKNLDEAFEKYPSEPENIEYYIDFLMEKNEKYKYEQQYQIGDIVYVTQYLYATGKPGYDHLFVIIDKEEEAVPIEHFGMLISSQIQKIKYNQNILLQKDNQNNLKKDSIVKTDQIYQLNKQNILFKIGNIDQRLVNEYRVRCLKSRIH